MPRKKNKHGLTPGELTSGLPDTWLPFTTTARLPPLTGVICQERAMRAVDAGLEIRTRGFNLFAAGEAGSGKTSTLVQLLEARAAALPIPDELCYVYDFRATDRPRPIRLPAGQGRQLAREMERVLLELERMIPRILSGGTFGHVRAGIQAETRRRAKELTRRAEQHAHRLGLELEGRDGDLRGVPQYQGKPVDEVLGSPSDPSLDIDWEPKKKATAAMAQDIHALLRRQKNPSMRLCLAAIYRNAVDKAAQDHVPPLLQLLKGESHQPTMFLQSSKVGPGLLQWLNLFTAAGLDACSERLQNSIFLGLRKKLEQVVDFSLQHQITAGDLMGLFVQVPLVGKVSLRMSGQLSTVIKDYGREQVLTALATLKALRTPENLCLSEVEKAWAHALSAERIVNALTGSTFTDVAATQLKITPQKLNCK